MNSPTDWLRRLTALKPAANSRLGPGNERYAPHKALLLLCVLELAEEHKLNGQHLRLTADLVLRFQSFWRVVVGRWTTKPDIWLPFHHLSTQGFWKPLTADLEPSKHRALTEVVEIDPAFLAAMANSDFRERARAVIISHYFPGVEQVALRVLTGTDTTRSEQAVQEIKEEACEYARRTARDARFRIEVVSAYDFTCALTGYKVTTIRGCSIVDAAHIHPHNLSNDNHPRNGLALSKNAHWMFDEGLWSVTHEFKIVVAEDAFTESSHDGFSLRNFQGKPLFFQSGCMLRPDPKYFAWHRENRFLRK